MSPFFVLCLFCFFRLLLLKNFSLASPRNDDPLLGRPTASLFFCPAGLARSVALRSPQGEALRAKCRARPTTNAARWRPTWKLASAPSGGPAHARDELPAASISVSLPKSAPGGTSCRLAHGKPAVALARRFAASAMHARRTRWPFCRAVLRTPTLCPAPAHSAGFAAPVGKSDCHTALPNRHSQCVHSRAGRYGPVPRRAAHHGDNPPAGQPPARNAGCVLADTPAPDKCWLLRDCGSLAVAVFSPSGPDACRADVPHVPWLAVNSRRSA